ncbi:MAG: Iron(3+)-hydroxamate import ATP-binding protein FhuC [Chloroflexi bacterium ADurb.Bin180]|nr:MAG: Iron(3+)-hydroxamate import ATP-binding protein FhuC [Chloroflexi bacterium ADurb.Bin180]
MSARPAISLRNAVFGYEPERAHVLNGLEAEVPAGKVTALLGPNGSGKTTLLHLILGLLQPTSGEVLLEGRPARDYTRKELSHTLGLVPQQEQVVFDITVAEYVLLGRAPHLGLLQLPSDEDLTVVEQSMAEAGMAGFRARTVPSLSGGEKQLATIARALAQRPAMFLLDEPTSHLDIGNRRRVLQLMRRLADGAHTVVFTTNDPNSAAAICDEVILMRGGRILAAGPIADTLTAEHLSATYGVDVEVITVHNRPLVVTH